MKLTYMGRFGLAMLVGVLAACSRPTTDRASTAINPSTVPSTPVVENPIAKIIEIQKLPVFVRLLNAPQEQPAKEGMGLQAGETIRTQGKALTQIDLINGLAFRLAGDAVLTLQPDNRLNLTAGDMITWVQPGKKVPTEIVTPVAVAGIRGTTVFVKIPKDPKAGILFFAWEGSVTVRLPGQTETVLLKTADEVRIKPGDRDIRQIRQRVRRLSRAEWRQKRQTDPLLRSFKKGKMSTLSIIERIKPGEVTLGALSESPLQVKTLIDSNADMRKQRDRIKQKLSKRTDKPGKPDKADKPRNPGKPSKPDKLDKPDKALKLKVVPGARKPDASRNNHSRPKDKNDRAPAKPEASRNDRAHSHRRQADP
ncbi:MAG: FecR family protein [Tildeniella nuda ZEHNDER 1965/U140]|nr:FecR family protein [Tildeniella nuda ZEHNDER 1965/U140]